jgi:hypothetical protein
MAHWMVEKMDIQTGSQSMVAYVWDPFGLSISPCCQHIRIIHFFCDAPDAISTSAPQFQYSYNIYYIVFSALQLYIYIVFLACGTGLWPAGRLMVNAEKIRDKSRDRFRPMTRDLVMAIQIEAYLALPSQKKTRT